MLLNRTAFGLPTDGEVALLYKDGAYGEGIRSAILEGTGAGFAVSVEYPAPGEGWDFSPAYEELLAIAPDVVVLIGTVEATDILAFLEHAWKLNGLDPIEWILTDGARGDALFTTFDKEAYASLDPVEVLGRVRGTALTPDTGPAFESFFERLESEHGMASSPAFASNAYDATYAIAFALGAAAAGKTPDVVFSSLHVSQGLQRLVGGQEVLVGPGALATGMGLLAQGANIDLEGASGSLDFDLGTGEPAVGPVDLWTPVWSSRTFVTELLLDGDGAPVSP
jgi:ABC-type branched-subunit amino acid transport system substrate-binding protein